MKEIFINRDEELKRVEALLDDKSNRIAIILGEGGIGKTRFLEEVIKRVSYNDNCILFLELDFDEYLPQQTIGYFNQKILSSVRSINPRLLETYDLELVVESPEFYTLLVNRASTQRKIFIFDTVEKLRNRPLKRQLFSYLTNIDNAVFIFAGRDATSDDQNEFDDFEEQARLVDGKYIKPIHLDKFSSENAQKYLRAKQYLIGVDINEQLADRIIKLTDGIPILIDLSVDYVVREIKLDDLFEKDSQNFRKELVQYIKQLSTPLDLLILILALVSPLSVESSADILGVTEAESRSLIDDAKQLSFVKLLPEERIKLHDEMEKLVIRFIWQSENPEIRPSEKFSEETLLKASKYFEDVDQKLSVKLKELKNKINSSEGSWEDRVNSNIIEQERAMVTVRWLEYGLSVNRDGIWNIWNDLYAKLRRHGKKYELVEQMLRVAEKEPIGVKDKRPFIDRLTEDQLIEYKLKHVTNQRDVGNLNDAKLELESMLQVHSGNNNVSATILNQLGAVYRDLGDYEKALKCQNECLEIIAGADQKNWWAIANVQNQLGFLYRLLEDKNNNALTLAEDHYISAIDAISNYKEGLAENKRQSNVIDTRIQINMLTASIMTNLGYIEGLKKNYQGAYDLLNGSVNLWIDAGREREVARTETAIGILKRDEARLDDALELMENAIERLHYPDDAAQMSITYFHYGWTQWFKAEELGLDTPEGINLLHIARQNLEDALEFASQKELEREKPGILHQLATVTWRLGFRLNNTEMMANARIINKEAIQESIRLDNMHYLIDAYTGECEFDLDILAETNIEETYRKVLSFETDFPQFVLFYGRVRRIRGDFYLLVEKSSDRAFEMYAEAIPLINLHSGYGPFHIHQELEGIFEKLSKLGKKEAETIIRNLKTKWVVYYENNKPGAIDVVNWCDNKLLKLQINSLSL